MDGWMDACPTEGAAVEEGDATEGSRMVTLRSPTHRGFHRPCWSTSYTLVVSPAEPPWCHMEGTSTSACRSPRSLRKQGPWVKERSVISVPAKTQPRAQLQQQRIHMKSTITNALVTGNVPRGAAHHHETPANPIARQTRTRLRQCHCS